MNKITRNELHPSLVSDLDKMTLLLNNLDLKTPYQESFFF